MSAPITGLGKTQNEERKKKLGIATGGEKKFKNPLYACHLTQ